MVGWVGVRVLTATNAGKYGINVDCLEATGTVAGHAANRPYQNSKLLIRQIIEGGTPRHDPQKVAGALRWDVPGTLYNVATNKVSHGTYELVIHPTTNRILHFLFKSN